MPVFPDVATGPPLVVEATYRRLTGDTASTPEAVIAALADAQALLQDALRRPLESAQRVEAVRVWADGLAYPLATPITVVPAGMTVEGHGVRGVPYEGLLGVLTYTGGWTALTLPMTLTAALSVVAYDLLHPDRSLVGARSYAVGDVSVTRGADDETSAPEWGRDVLAYRRRDI